jgi:hypothetical protein
MKRRKYVTFAGYKINVQLCFMSSNFGLTRSGTRKPGRHPREVVATCVWPPGRHGNLPDVRCRGSCIVRMSLAVDYIGILPSCRSLNLICGRVELRAKDLHVLWLVRTATTPVDVVLLLVYVVLEFRSRLSEWFEDPR